MFKEESQAKMLAIDAALNTLPVYPAPAGLKRRVMAEVSRLEAGSLPAAPFRVKYRLDFLDFALPVFFALFGMLGLAALLVILSLLDPLWLLRLQLALQALAWRLPALPQGMLWLFLGASVAGLVLALLVAGFWLAPIRLDIKYRPRIGRI